MIIKIIIQALLGLGFLMFGYQKFTSEDMKKGFEYCGCSNSFRIFTGSFEMLSAVVVIIGIWVKPLATIGGLMIVATMIAALITHLKIKDQVKNMIMAFILLIMAIVVVILNWCGLF